MTTFTFPSLMNELKVGFTEARINIFHSHKTAKRQFARSEEYISREYANATTVQRLKAGDCSLAVILGNNLSNPYINGDIDLLEAYEKFSIFEYPSLPLAVNNFRCALGKHKVADIITREHLDLHKRVAEACSNIFTEDEIDSRVERQLNKVGVFVFSNMDHADDILRIVELRKLIDPKDIAAVLDSRDMSPVLMEGAL